jgi:hypothetical protein
MAPTQEAIFEDHSVSRQRETTSPDWRGNNRTMSEPPNILLITTDEERANLPRPPGYCLPARERVAERGVRFANYYTASSQCSSARSVIYSGRHVPITRIYDNDNFPYSEPLDPTLGTPGDAGHTWGRCSGRRECWPQIMRGRRVSTRSWLVG